MSEATDYNTVLSLAYPGAPIEPIIAFWKQKGMLSSQKICKSCETHMTWMHDGAEKPRYVDRYHWKCLNAHCAARYTTISIRDGTFFRQ